MFTPLQELGESYHFVFYDQRGSLLSPCPAAAISVQKHVEDLERLRIALGLNRMDIVAHSMGTFLAMEYQEAHPEHVREMVLMGTIPPRRAPKTDADKKLGAEQQRISAEFIARPEIAAELHKDGLDGDEKSLTPKQATNKWRIQFAAANVYHVDRWEQVRGGKAYFNTVAGQAAGKTMPPMWDFTTSLAKQTCPTWVIDGDHDYVDPAGRFFASAMAGDDRVHVVSIPDAGHVSWVDDPAGVAKELREALESGSHCGKE